MFYLFSVTNLQKNIYGLPLLAFNPSASRLNNTKLRQAQINELQTFTAQIEVRLASTLEIDTIYVVDRL